MPNVRTTHGDHDRTTWAKEVENTVVQVRQILDKETGRQNRYFDDIRQRVSSQSIQPDVGFVLLPQKRLEVRIRGHLF